MDNTGWDKRQKGPSLAESLESPFLEDELFIQRSPQEWERPVTRLEAESPFGRAFEHAQGMTSYTEMLDPEVMEWETGAAQQSGVSTVAVNSIKQWPDRANRPADWQGKIYGLVVHTSGSGVPKRAEKDRVSPTKWAIGYYKNSRGCHYVNGWGGIEGGDLVQIANESFEAWGVGFSNPKEPNKGQRQSIEAGRFEMDLPPILVKLWRKRWPSHKHSLELLPKTKTANSCYVHVECPPCVYHGQKSGLTTGAPPLQTRSKLRFTKAQHDAVAHLAVDIARRNGWPMSETWWRSPRLLGHEDLTPLSRSNKKGGWDPGYLREEPYFDWDYVYGVIESILQGRGTTPTASGNSIGSGILSTLGNVAQGFSDLVTTGKERLAISLAYRQGKTDENTLTSLVFHTRHPELRGRRIRKEEHSLAQEWLRIRDELVRPFLQSASASEMTLELNEAFEEEIELLEPFLNEWEYDDLLAEPELAYESEEGFEDYAEHEHDLADQYKSDLSNSEETVQLMEEEDVAKLPAELVHFAQRVLNAAESERLQEDGKFGRLTGGALERFRAKYSLGAGGVLDRQTELALAQRALETLAQASMFAKLGTRDARTDEALITFKLTRQVGNTPDLDAPTRQALAEALRRIGAKPQPGQGSAPVSTTPSMYAGGKLWTFPATTLSLRVAVFCPPAALSKSNVEVLVYAHGLLNPCKKPRNIPSGIITEFPFKLGNIVADSGQPVVLVVPYLDWSNPRGAAVFGKDRRKWHALGKPSYLNALIDEVLIEVGRVQSMPKPQNVNLMIAGHSRAYDFLEPLAHSHADPQMKQDNLAKLSQVWAFDTTYAGNLKNWLGWLRENPNLKVTLFYKRNSPTEAIGRKFESSQGSQLRVIDSNERHCAVPGKRLPGLLNPARPSPNPELESPWTEIQTQWEDWDLEAEEDDLQTEETEASYDDFWADTGELDETVENEWEEEEHHHVDDFAALEQELLEEVDTPTEPELEALAFEAIGSDEVYFDEELTSSSPSTSDEQPSGLLSLMMKLPGFPILPSSFLDALMKGNRDENHLTNLVFFNRHPELGGRKLTAIDPQSLKSEWGEIRQSIVRPALRRIQESGNGRSVSSSTSSSAPVSRPTSSGVAQSTSMSDSRRAGLIAAAITQATTAGNEDDRQAIAQALKLNGSDIKTWFSNIVPDATFLGRPIRASGGKVPGVHRSLFEVLQRAEKMLLDAHPGRTAEELGKQFNIYDIAGIRPPKKATGGTLPSYHCFGLAIDINHRTNPFVGNRKGKLEQREKYTIYRSPAIIQRAMWLLRGQRFDVEKPVPTDSGDAWDIHQSASVALAEYLRLADNVDSPQVQKLVTESQARGDTNGLEWWKSWLIKDRSNIKNWDFQRHPNPQQRGYLDLPRQLVVTLVTAGLNWGGQYRREKDMMHFDLRSGPITKR